MSEKTNIRFIDIQGTIYLRKEDVIDFWRDFAEAEETDTRNRILEAVNNINSAWKNEYA
jgi:hypothetical protein